MFLYKTLFLIGLNVLWLNLFRAHVKTTKGKKGLHT